RFSGQSVESWSGPQVGALLKPIATPLLIGGFGGDTADLVSRSFAASGFEPMSGAGRAVEPAGNAGALRPGDPIGVGLINGDLALGATGTVTNVIGDRVYAFGHPFYNLGPTTFPMTTALVHVVLPSLMASTKIASLG